MALQDEPAELHEAVSRAAYERWHEARDVDADADSPWHELIKTHVEFERDVESKRVLEVACGRGGFTCWLARQTQSPSQITAVDFASSAVQKGRAFAARQSLRGIVWEQGDIQSLAYPDGSFDTVFSCETIEHVPEPRRAVGELVRVLKPGGRLFLTTPNYLGTLGLYRAYLHLCGRTFTEVGQPINKFVVLPATKRWVVHAGARVTVVDAVGHYLPFPGRPPIRISLLDKLRYISRWLAHHSLIVAEKL